MTAVAIVTRRVVVPAETAQLLGVRPRALIIVGLLLASACGPAERGDRVVGQSCGEDNDCVRGYCVGGLRAEAEGSVCTVSCARASECPQGWSCSAVTQDNVLVCSPGAPTPFGIGAND